MQYAELAHKIRMAVEKRTAEAAFRESQLHLSTIVNSIQVGIVTVDAKTHQILNVNPKALEMVGRDRDEVIGSVCHRFICPAQAGSCPVTDLGQKVDLAERVLLDKTGNKVPILKSVMPVTIAGKDLLIETFFDITERKAAENAFQTLMKSMVTTTGTASLDNITLNVSRWLGADFSVITEFTEGISYAKIISQQPASVMPIPDGPIPMKGTPCGLAAEKGFSICTDNAQQTFPECRMLAENNIKSHVGTALRDSEGKVIGTLCAFSTKPLIAPPQIQELFELIGVKAAAEIERKHTEGALKESERRLKSLIASMNDLVFVLDRNLVFMDYHQNNRENLFVRPEQFVGRHFDEIGFPEPARGILKNVLEQALKTENPQKAVYYLDMQNGRSWYDIQVTSNQASDGTSIGLTCVVRDITENKRTEEALLQVNKKLTLLSGITRHDITNQFTSLDGYLAILDSKITEPSIREVLKKTSNAADRIAAVMQFTREYEKIGIQAPVWHTCRTLIGNAGAQAPLGQIMLKNDLPADLEILADPLISLVISNLIDNALRYARNIATIQVTFQEQDGDGIIRFGDDGTGIPAEEKEMIFEFGYGKNTGMGLFLSRQILDITGITIRENGEPGKGAVFEIRVPGRHLAPQGRR